MINRNIIFTLLFIIYCTSAPRYTQSPSSTKRKSSSVKKIKVPTTKVQSDKSKRVLVGTSSYYGTAFHGKLTANGEIFDMYGVTAAHKTLPLNTVVRVTNLDNTNSIILRINDRGPYIQGRILDCSYGAAKKLGFVNDGMANIEMKVIEWGDNKYMSH